MSVSFVKEKRKYLESANKGNGLRDMKPMNAEQLLIDVAHHVLTIRTDNGLYRHLRFRQPDTGNMWFEIVTWPGSLTIHGDMGTWSFSRVDDMFTFFRSGDGLRINASYWHEKVNSESRFGGPSRKFSPERFKENVLSRLEDYGLSAPEKADIVADLKDSVFCEEDESSARRALSYFKRDGFQFSDTWEIDGRAYSFHYLWCLYAIVWAIQQYDAAKVAGEHGAARATTAHPEAAEPGGQHDGGSPLK